MELDYFLEKVSNQSDASIWGFLSNLSLGTPAPFQITVEYF